MISKKETQTEEPGSGLALFDTPSFQRMAVVLIVLVVALRVLYLLFAAWDFNTDDAYITLRYARHLAEGHGFAWNVGEAPVEGYSNFLFVVLGAAAIKLGADPVVFLKILSCLALALTCGLLYRLTRPWAGPIGATLPAMALTLYIGTIWWTVSGLETAVYQMIVVAAVAAFFQGLGAFQETQHADLPRRSWSGRWLVLAGVLVFLAGLTRPEGPLIGVAFGAALIVDVVLRAVKSRAAGGSKAVFQKGAAMAVVLALSFALPYGLYFAWRFGYFGRLLPNTVYCKSIYDGDPLLLIRAFWSTAWPAFALAFVALAAMWRRFDVRVFVLALIVALYVLVLYGVDPIVGHLNRHFLTAFALLLVLATAGLLRLARWGLPRLPGALREFVLAVLLLGVLCATVSDDRALLRVRASHYAERMEAREDLGHWLNNRLTPDDTFVIGDAGMVPYVARANVLDAFCLNCAAMTRPPINHSTVKIVDYFLERRPEMIVVHSNYPDRLEPRAELGIYPLLLEQDAFAAQYDHVHTIGAGTFHYWVFERNDR